MSGIAPGPRNLITDVEGLMVGNAEDQRALTGVTVLIPDAPVVASCDVRGGAPGTRETEALDPACLVETVHGFVLSGGSVFGLEAASGVVNWLACQGRGFTFAPRSLPAPVVPSAILFDLLNGGDKAWGMDPPYRALALKACDALGGAFALGNVGAGMGALAGRFKGGLGSASGDLWAADLALADELPQRLGARSGVSLTEGTKFELAPAHMAPGANTTIAVIATDAALTKAEARRLAIMAHDGMARALRPVHTPFDGDTIFALATSRRPLDEPRAGILSHLGAIAADTLTRAIGRAVWEAESIGPWLSYRDQRRGKP
jgi:L-aminopeptidase/D-esterase-like protein